MKSENKVFSDETLYQIREILSGVPKRGTAARAFEGVEYKTYGKTGTSNGAKDV